MMATVPWIVRNQTIVPSFGEVINPPSPTSSAQGFLEGLECLPYVVPAGKRLHIKRITIEPLWGAAIIPYLGSGPMGTFTNSLDTFATGGIGSNIDQTNQPVLETKDWETDYWLPAGARINMRLSAQWNPGSGWIYGWSMSGELVDV